MILTERKIWLSTLILFLALWLGGCSMQYSDEELRGMQAQEDGISLVLNISTGDVANFGSRAEDYSFEQAILDTEKIQSLRIIIVDTQEGSETQNQVIANYSTGNLSYARFNISGIRFDGLNFSNDYRIYLIANESSLPTAMQNKINAFFEGDVYDGSFETLTLNATTAGAGNFLINNMPSYLGSTGSAKPIPMTEFFDITTDPRPDTTAEEITVYIERDFFITRAASKFSFTIKKDPTQSNANYGKVKSISIFGLGEIEYLYPTETVYDPPKYQPSNNEYGGREITSFILPEVDEGKEVGSYKFYLPEPVDVSTITDENGYTFSPQIYFPEGLGYSGEDPFLCSITFDDENGEDIVTAPITLPNLPKLPRNTHVKVILKIRGNYIEAEVRVLPYTGVWLNPTFGIDRD